MGDVSHTLTSEGHDASEDGSGRGTPIVGSHGDAHAGPTGTLTRMYSEQSGQDFGGGQESSRVVCEPDPAGALTKRYAKGVNTTMDDGAIIANSDSYWVEDCENAALRANGAHDGPPRTDKHPIITQTFPIDDGREVEKHQNGTGIGDADAPAYTLDRQQRPAVVQTFSVYPEGGNDADIAASPAERSPSLTKVKSERGIHVASTAATLTSGGHPNSNAPGRRNEDDVNLVPFNTEFSNQASREGDVMHALDRNANAGVANRMTVRRLTPVECERLMGWPDNFTAPEGVKAADSKRYAACGDGIVAPVAFWIADRISMIEEEGGV